MKTSVILLAFGLLACSVCEHSQDFDDQESIKSQPEERMVTALVKCFNLASIPPFKCIETTKLNLSCQNTSFLVLFCFLKEQQLPGTCWACKWALNKVKKNLPATSNQEQIKGKLLAVCNKVGLLKSLCKSFVNKNLMVLIEELSTTDDVRTICVNIKACKPKEDLDLSY
uniref:Saposin B-type domain-containing protein n=1 Tax=Esox lucius TaxID=8010 RepID=A0AAY5L411_ESOLU